MVKSVGRKSEAAHAVIGMVRQMENIMNASPLQSTIVQRNNVKWSKTDGGSECTGCRFQNRTTQRGIMHGVSAIYSPESKGAAERLIRTFFEMARTMLLDMDVPRNSLCAKATHTASFLRNHLLTKSCRDYRSPYEEGHNERPKLDCVQVVGSRAYVHSGRESCSGKFESRALLGTLARYCRENMYRVLLPGINNTKESQDVETVKPSNALQNWDCKKIVDEFCLSDKTVFFDDSSQIKDPLANISVHETNQSVSASSRIKQTEPDSEAGSDSETVPYYLGQRTSGRQTPRIPPERLGYKTAHMTTEVRINCNIS